MKKIVQSLIVVGLILTLSSCGNSKADQPAQAASALQVEAYEVTAEAYNNEVLTTANLMAEEQVELKAPMAGQVLAIYFKEGQYVNKGQTLVRLDDRSWKAELLGVNAELVAAENDYSRKNDLLSIGGSSQEEIDIAFSQVEILKSKQQQLQVSINLANVTAPFSGQLGMRDFSEGAFLSQGDVITTLSANQQLKVDFTVAQSNASSIEINSVVKVIIGTDTLSAKVYAINPVINTETRMIKVRALLQQKGANKIKPGTFAEVLIATEMTENAILIPTQAVVPSINEQTVYVYKNGKAERKTVLMGNRNADKVLILKGLSVGDTVITTGLLNIKEGMDIQIQTVK